MKRTLILMLIAMVYLKTFGQISQGSIVVGGDLSLSLSKDKTEQNGNTTDGPSRSNFGIGPNVEYFLAENFSAGLGIGYTLNKTKSESSNVETILKNGMFTVSPYLKKYLPIGDRAYFYGQAIASFGFGKQTTETKVSSTTVSVEKNTSKFSLGIVPGFRYDVSDKVALEAGIGFWGFSQNAEKSGSGNSKVRKITNSFQFSFIPNALTLGICYTL